MIFLSKDFFNTSEETNKLLEKKKELLDLNIKIQTNMKEIILNYIQNFVDFSNPANVDSATCILNFLENLKSSLNLCNENITDLKNCVNDFDNITSSIKKNDSDLDNILKTFNSKYYKFSKSIVQNTLQIQNCINSISKISNLTFAIFQSNSEHYTNESNVVDETECKIETIVTPKIEYIENTLIVSEMSGKVTLPYKMSEIKEIFENNANKYSSIDEIILKTYTLPIEMFKNPFIARFKEAFKLIKNKERGSVFDAIELGTELMFNYNLHPAIISACKNLDELDIYLDYLENGETNKFDCFKVVFELPPAIVKQKNPF